MTKTNTKQLGLSYIQCLEKRIFDLAVSTAGLLLTGWIIIIAFILASIDTKKSGFFTQTRVGKGGKYFKVIKIRSMRNFFINETTVTVSNDPRITKLGRFLRKTKIDELPQLINVFLGNMSFVGPRPDVPGFADKVQGEAKVVLSLRAGITGPATLKYKDEEEILAKQSNPEKYNENVIFPDKVRINIEYINNYNFWKDMVYIFRSI